MLASFMPSCCLSILFVMMTVGWALPASFSSMRYVRFFEFDRDTTPVFFPDCCEGPKVYLRSAEPGVCLALTRGRFPWAAPELLGLTVCIVAPDTPAL